MMVHHGDRFDRLEREVFAVQHRLDSVDDQLAALTGAVAEMREMTATMVALLGGATPSLHDSQRPISTPMPPRRPARTGALVNAFTPIDDDIGKAAELAPASLSTSSPQVSSASAPPSASAQSSASAPSPATAASTTSAQRNQLDRSVTGVTTLPPAPPAPAVSR
ncbi:hypothetical protein BCR44DRAFT_350386 [Catenaria anguillulae PL171]|uniref:Uncharacterized protein n=1 Tax=Catenaria anguillulae PL171 TaxID=765915 RepID=A0A1Y2HGS7_9FUNG|nr:hypothetical protein BCR44DRAFT_350386 [Catenaria anguillulae PL171]